MKSKSNIQLDLSNKERKNLRTNKIKKADLLDFACDEIQEIMNVSKKRAKEIYALADFQQIPSIGIKFARDLIYLGYQSIEELKGKNGAKLTDEYEKKKGFNTDPCVEDQFRLAVDFAENRNFSKNWWDFTKERKNIEMNSATQRTGQKRNGPKFEQRNKTVANYVYKKYRVSKR